MNNPMITAMALWEAVLDEKYVETKKVAFTSSSPVNAAFCDNGYSAVRYAVSKLVPVCDEAWAVIQKDFDSSWDWDFLPIVVKLWVEANFDVKAVTVEKIVAAAVLHLRGN